MLKKEQWHLLTMHACELGVKCVSLNSFSRLSRLTMLTKRQSKHRNGIPTECRCKKTTKLVHFKWSSRLWEVEEVTCQRYSEFFLKSLEKNISFIHPKRWNIFRYACWGVVRGNWRSLGPYRSFGRFTGKIITHTLGSLQLSQYKSLGHFSRRKKTACSTIISLTSSWSISAIQTLRKRRPKEGGCSPFWKCLSRTWKCTVILWRRTTTLKIP